ncbi:MAG: hypothetical protein K9J27_12335 [Bacteroidales bacterium]|nr:hypothetical protein [Bacteroidales bacterium]
MLKSKLESVMTKLVIIDTRSEEAKKIVEFLKTTNYAKVVDKEPNAETIQAMEEVEKGNVNTYQSVKELMNSLKKKNSVQD